MRTLFVAGVEPGFPYRRHEGRIPYLPIPIFP